MKANTATQFNEIDICLFMWLFVIESKFKVGLLLDSELEQFLDSLSLESSHINIYMLVVLELNVW